jgi:hypothetical protein
LATAQENQRNCTVRAALILNQNWPVLNLAGPFMTRSAEPNALGVREGRLAEQCRRRRTPALARRLRPTCRRRSPARSAAARALRCSTPSPPRSARSIPASVPAPLHAVATLRYAFFKSCSCCLTWLTEYDVPNFAFMRRTMFVDGRRWVPTDWVTDVGAGRLDGRRWEGPRAVSCRGDGAADASGDGAAIALMTAVGRSSRR